MCSRRRAQTSFWGKDVSIGSLVGMSRLTKLRFMRAIGMVNRMHYSPCSVIVLIFIVYVYILYPSRILLSIPKDAILD